MKGFTIMGLDGEIIYRYENIQSCSECPFCYHTADTKLIYCCAEGMEITKDSFYRNDQSPILCCLPDIPESILINKSELIRLQNAIDTLTESNRNLQTKLKEMEGE